MDITLSTTVTKARERIATIGKHTPTKDGSSVFIPVTSSSAEGTVLTDFSEEAAHKVISSISHFMRSVRLSSGHLIAQPVLVADEDILQYEIERYIVHYIVAKWLMTYSPTMAQPYTEEASKMLQAIRMYVHYRPAPIPSEYDYSDIKEIEP